MTTTPSITEYNGRALGFQLLEGALSPFWIFIETSANSHEINLSLANQSVSVCRLGDSANTDDRYFHHFLYRVRLRNEVTFHTLKLFRPASAHSS